MPDTFNIFLVNEANSDDGWNDRIRGLVADRIRELFDIACKNSTKFGNSAASWSTSAPTVGTVADHELVLYFLQSKKRSKVVKEGGDQPTLAGATWQSTKGMISEVYVEDSWGDGQPGKLFGNLAFHEFMHNKLDAHATLRSMSDIHLQGGRGLALMPLNAGSTHTDDNMKFMRAALDRKIKQYLG